MIYGIVPAAGSGTRMRLDPAGPSKQYLPFGTGTVLTTTLKALWQPGLLAGLIVVVPEADVGEVTRGLQALPFSVSLQVVAGGATRQESVRRGLEAVPEEAEYVVVHDAVRPLVTKQIIERGGGGPAVRRDGGPARGRHGQTGRRGRRDRRNRRPHRPLVHPDAPGFSCRLAA